MINSCRQVFLCITEKYKRKFCIFNANMKKAKYYISCFSIELFMKNLFNIKTYIFKCLFLNVKKYT